MSTAPPVSPRKFRWARRLFWVGFGLVGLNLLLLVPFLLASPAALIVALLAPVVVGGLAAGLGALFDLARGRVARPIVALIILLVYGSGYAGARASRTLVHRTTFSGGSVSHRVGLGDPGFLNAFPILRLAVGLVFLPACAVESLVWQVADR
jgi:hypothetical protein